MLWITLMCQLLGMITALAMSGTVVAYAMPLHPFTYFVLMFSRLFQLVTFAGCSSRLVGLFLVAGHPMHGILVCLSGPAAIPLYVRIGQRQGVEPHNGLSH